MLQFAFVVLVFAALIAVVFGQKAAQGFVRFVVGAGLVLLAAVVFLLYKLDQVGKAPDQPAVAAAQLYALPTSPATPAPQPARAARWVACPTCGGSGRLTCAACGGTGQQTQPAYQSKGPYDPPPVDMQNHPCPVCSGAGTVTCAACGGAGGHYE